MFLRVFSYNPLNITFHNFSVFVCTLITLYFQSGELLRQKQQIKVISAIDLATPTTDRFQSVIVKNPNAALRQSAAILPSTKTVCSSINARLVFFYYFDSFVLIFNKPFLHNFNFFPIRSQVNDVLPKTSVAQTKNFSSSSSSKIPLAKLNFAPLMAWSKKRDTTSEPAKNPKASDSGSAIGVVLISFTNYIRDYI